MPAPAAFRLSSACAKRSRGHGHSPALLMLSASIVTIVTVPLGASDSAFIRADARLLSRDTEAPEKENPPRVRQPIRHPRIRQKRS